MRAKRLVAQPGVEVEGERAALQSLQHPYVERDRSGGDRLEELRSLANPPCRNHAPLHCLVPQRLLPPWVKPMAVVSRPRFVVHA
jgi:hypothetical protein